MGNGELNSRLFEKLVKIRQGAQSLDQRVVNSFFQRLAYEFEVVVKEAKEEWKTMKPNDWASKWLNER